LLRVLIGFGVLSGEKSLIRQVKPLLISYSMLLSHFIETGASTLVTGQSYGLNEKPIVDIVRALHKKTIWWSYSGQSAKSYPNLKLPKYQYEQIQESITLSEEKCVWNNSDKNILLARNLIPMHENQTKLTVTGPLMSGDSKWVKLISDDARQKYSNFNGNKACKLWITVFDLPVYVDNSMIMHRWPVGIITKEFEISFFRDIELILEKYQNIGIIYKPKRRVEKSFFESDVKNKLFSEDNPLFLSGRVVKLPYNIDPYIAISMGDVAMAMPYTSALFASISFKRDGIYYDPLSNLGSAYPELVNSITLNSFKQLCNKVESWLRGEIFINNDALEVLKHKGDPIVNFTSLL
jgi:polysaccharide biosynthesis PFTS motif protein